MAVNWTHGDRVELIHSRSYFSSKKLANTETKAEGEQEEPIKKERKPDEPAYAPKGALVEPEWPPFGRYPYAWIGLTIATLFLFGYTWFIFREEKMIERYEFMKWGGTLDRIHSLQKIRKYLIYDCTLFCLFLASFASISVLIRINRYLTSF